VDFRGRAYPIPPHLSNIGSDICRGMLMFADGKPLGDRGLYWLKVHLANFAGNDKITFDERAKFVDEHMRHVRSAALDPLGEDRWWMTLDDPFQGLATCMEIVNAIDSGNPATYVCSLPVHMDGSCNGLQHYAALGRDRHGGKAVNLCATEQPQDVYIGVMEEVKRRVAAEAAKTLGFDDSNFEDLSKEQRKELLQNRAAKLVDGLIDRGVVKRVRVISWRCRCCRLTVVLFKDRHDLGLWCYLHRGTNSDSREN
jgi:DNA-directed RNA polymerase, mitochondrial